MRLDVRRASWPLWLLCAALSAQTPTAEFRLAPLMPILAATVFDAQRGVTVALERPTSTRRMWQWDGIEFRQVLGPNHAYSQSRTLTCDPARGEIHSLDIVAELVRTWDGRRWRATPYPAGWTLSSGNFAWDAARQRLVAMFVLPQQNPDVAEWDGTTWTRITPVSNPGTGGSLVYDPSRGKCVYAVSSPIELWEWNGADWALFATNGPTGTAGHLSHDPGNNRLVHHGSSGFAAVTWTFDAGNGWQQIAIPAGFPAGIGNLAYDGTGMLHLDSFYQQRGFWRLEGAVWQRLAIDHPEVRRKAGLASSPARILQFGGELGVMLDDTWIFDGAWQRRTPPLSPSHRAEAGLAWGPGIQVFVLFGGRYTTVSGTTLYDDTWTFDGAQWTNHLPATVPPPRSRPLLVSDPAGPVVLLNTTATSQSNNDQWRWNGIDWIQMPSFTPAFAGARTAAAFDPNRNRVVVASENTTSEWDGTTWTAAGGNPLAWQTDVHLVYRPQTQRVLAFEKGRTVHHEWDGTAWTSVNIALADQPYEPALVADHARGRVLSLYHRHSTSLPAEMEHAAVLTSVAAEVESFGSGCAAGTAPALMTLGHMRPAAPAAALRAVTGAPQALTLFALGFTQLNAPLGSGCTLLVGNAIGTVATLTDGIGDATVALVVPPSSAFLGIELVAQSATVDPGNSVFGGVTLSDGLRVVIGH